MLYNSSEILRYSCQNLKQLYNYWFPPVLSKKKNYAVIDKYSDDFFRCTVAVNLNALRKRHGFVSNVRVQNRFHTDVGRISTDTNETKHFSGRTDQALLACPKRWSTPLLHCRHCHCFVGWLWPIHNHTVKSEIFNDPNGRRTLCANCYQCATRVISHGRLLQIQHRYCF